MSGHNERNQYSRLRGGIHGFPGGAFAKGNGARKAAHGSEAAQEGRFRRGNRRANLAEWAMRQDSTGHSNDEICFAVLAR